jgi:dihydrofolate reductase
MPDPVFVIGGARPWAEAIAIASSIYLTEIDAEYEGDTHFPLIDPREWRQVKCSDRVPASRETPSYRFVEYGRLTE